MIQAERKGFYRDLAIVYHNLPGGDTVSQPEIAGSVVNYNFLNCLKCVILCFGFFLLLLLKERPQNQIFSCVHLFVGAHERKCLCNDD